MKTDSFLMPKNRSRRCFFVIYCRPSDFSDQFVVRRWEIHDPDPPTPSKEQWCVANTLGEARASIPPDFIRIQPFRDEDPVLEEVWI